MEILYKELSYRVVGAAITTRKTYGLGHKERIYQNAFAEELEKRKMSYVKEPSLVIRSLASGKSLGIYRPDFLIEDKVVVELKAQRLLTPSSWQQLYHYLRNSKFELAYLINFSPSRMTVKRVIYTNVKKRR